MNPTLTFEAEPFEIESELTGENRCQCATCRGQSEVSDEMDPEAGDAGREVEDEIFGEEEVEDESFAEEAPVGALDCSRVPTDCLDRTAAEQRAVRRAGKAEGDMLDRTQGDPDKNLSLQLTDYDVNDWLPGKERHRQGLAKVLTFIGDRAAQIAVSPTGIEVTLTGAASRTGTRQYNDILSCKRATCAASFLRNALSFRQVPGHSLLGLNKIRFTTGGKGFQDATCRGKDCEVGEFRSVLISVHRPGLPPPPVPVVPPGWDKYRIRNCSFKTDTLQVFLIKDLIERGIGLLPESIRRRLEQSEAEKKLLGKALGLLISKLKDLLRKAPGLLGRALGGIMAELAAIPVELIADTGIFQIVERAKPNPAELVLRYTGFGFRVIIPREFGGLPIPTAVRELIRKFFVDQLKLDGVSVAIVLEVLSGKIPAFESTTPGEFTDFDVNRKVKIKLFEGDSEVLKGLQPGVVFLGFSGPQFVRPDPVQRVKLTCPIRRCNPSQIPVTIGKGTGFEVVAPTKGSLSDCACKCVEGPAKAAVRQITARRLLAARPAAFRGGPIRRAVRRG